MSRFRNDTGSVLRSQEFGLIPPGEFEAEGYDPEVHGVIPGCVWLDAPEPVADPGSADVGQPADTAASTSRKRKGAGDEGKENPE